MASLVPCTACRRHVRRHEIQCRFCGVALAPSVPAREVVIPRDAKRATIFALGLTLAGQACGGETDVPVDGGPPGIGASGGAGGGNGTGGNGMGGTANGGASNSAGQAGEPNVQPVYGAPAPPFDPGPGGSSGSTGLPDASTPPNPVGEDAGSNDAGPDDAGD